MSRGDWKVVNLSDVPDSSTWVYYERAASFPGVHVSWSLDDPSRHHAATNSTPKCYYYPASTGEKFTVPGGGEVPQDKRTLLKNAWDDWNKI